MSKTVAMIVDSQPFFRAGVQQVLAGGNGSDAMEIVECDPGPDGNKAIARISAEPPDVVLLDIVYPFLNGLELGKRIVRNFPGTPVVILSTNPEEDDGELFEAIKAGAAGYLRSKHCSPAEVTKTIRRASSGEYPINDGVSRRPEVARRVLRQFQEMTSGVRKEDNIAFRLTAKEVQILTLVAEGNANKQIAVILGIGEQTIKNHVSSILRKLNANDRAHAVMLAVRNGWVPVYRDRTRGRRRRDSASEALHPPTTHPN